MENALLDKILREAFQEDIGDGDHTTLSVIPETALGKSVLLAKEKGVLAGVRIVNRLIELVVPELEMDIRIQDGHKIQPGDEVMFLSGPSRSILMVERLALNILQRMSGIATQTNSFVEAVKGTQAVILDTRKTTPNLRSLEKEAVRIGGGQNHRFGLYDMILLKDNHIDFAGGIEKAILMVNDYLKRNTLNLQIEIEVRDFDELDQVLETGQINRIMLDNFSPEETRQAVSLIDKRFEIESSGGIRLENIRDYAMAGVDFVSVGALTHQILSLDLSLKAL